MGQEYRFKSIIIYIWEAHWVGPIDPSSNLGPDLSINSYASRVSLFITQPQTFKPLSPPKIIFSLWKSVVFVSWFDLVISRFWVWIVVIISRSSSWQSWLALWGSEQLWMLMNWYQNVSSLSLNKLLPASSMLWGCISVERSNTSSILLTLQFLRLNMILVNSV